MIILIKSVMVMMLCLIFSIAFGIVLIPLLKQKKLNQRLSIYLEEKHKNKKDVPTMGGLIFIIPTIIVIFILLIFNKIEFSMNFIIIIFTFISYSLIGFIDDYLIIKRNNNNGLKEGTKFFMQVIVAIVFFYLFMISNNEPLLWIHSLNIKLNIGWLYGIFILFVLVASSNAVNLTDGLDGLAGGLSLIALLTLGIITWNTTWLNGYEEIAILCFCLVGSILGFLVFNVNPAKIFMGDTGSLALGATMGAIAILTRHELLLILIGIVFIIETVSCIIQRLYYKLTHKRIFLMTPIHHSFEKKGYNEKDIVKVFWIIGIIANMLALTFGVLL